MAMAPIPLLLSMDGGKTYEGFLSIGDGCIEERICFSITDGSFWCGERLGKLLWCHKDAITTRLNASSTPEEFYSELEQISNRCLEVYRRKLLMNDSVHIGRPRLPDFFYGLLHDFDEIGWECITPVGSGFCAFDIAINDSTERIHILRMNVPSHLPNAVPTFAAVVPGTFRPAWIIGKTRVVDIVVQFKNLLMKYLDFWECMDEIDAKTWVLEPERPICSYTSRRIALGNHITLQIDVDPIHPRELPEVHVLGNETTVQPIRARFTAGVADWHPSLTPFQNLQIILDIEFPSRPTTTADEIAATCGICYAYRLDDSSNSDNEVSVVAIDSDLLPTILCANSKCARVFHQRCLCEWLHGLTSMRQSYNTIFGECPYCTTHISVLAKQ